MCFFHYTNRNKHTGMGINGDKIMSLHISSIETQQTSTYICIFFLVCFFLFCCCFVGLRKKEKQEMQKELRIMPGEDKPNVSVLTTTGFMCLLVMCVVERGVAEVTTSCSVLLNPHSHGHCSAHLCYPRLRQKELSVGYLIQMTER